MSDPTCLFHGLTLHLRGTGVDAVLVCAECCDDLDGHSPTSDANGDYMPSGGES